MKQTEDDSFFISGQIRPGTFSSSQTARINTANEFQVFPLPPSHPHHRLHSGTGSLRPTVLLMKVCKFIAQRLQEPHRGSFSNYLLLNQFTGREPRARLGDYCYGEAGALIACLSNLTNTPGAGSQIER